MNDDIDSSTALPLLLRVDPRARVAAAVGFSAVVAVCNRPLTLVLALASGVLAARLAGFSVRSAARRLAPANVVMLVLFIVLPLTALGGTIVRLGPVSLSSHGFWLAAGIAVKGNAILLAVAALIGTLDLPRFGHALAHLRVPEKLVHLLLFTARYVELLEREAARLADAMKVRGFQPGFNWHTLRTHGYLAGMLLVNSARRGDRIVAAMKCRGFQGRFFLLDHFSFSWLDAPFALASSIVVIGLMLLEWT